MSSRVVRAVALAPVIVGLLVVTLLTGGCRAHADAVPIPVSSPTVAPIAGPIAFHVQLGAGQHLTTYTPQPDKCPDVLAYVDLGSDDGVTLAASATSCASQGNNSQLGNGRHGVYRTSADIPAERRAGAQTVHTALGDALVFTQGYYECTNGCNNYTEPVAVITLAQPREPAVQTLTVISPKGTMGQDQLAAFVRDQLLA